MLFETDNQLCRQQSRCAVSEEEGTASLTNFEEHMQLQEGKYMKIISKNLEKGTCRKLQSHSMDFLAIPNPKAFLQSLLTPGDTKKIQLLQEFYIDITETRHLVSLLHIMRWLIIESLKNPAKEEMAAMAKDDVKTLHEQYLPAFSLQKENVTAPVIGKA